MDRRSDLGALLRKTLGSSNVYFQPPETVKLKYPCIIYTLSGERVRHAEGILYFHRDRYTVNVIDKNPDSEIPDKIRALPYCTFDRFYTADNLNHFVYTIFY